MTQEGGIQAGGDITAGGDMAGRDIVHKAISFSMDDWFSRSEQMVREAGLDVMEEDYVMDELQALQRETAKPEGAWNLERIWEMIGKIAPYVPVVAQALIALFKAVPI